MSRAATQQPLHTTLEFMRLLWDLDNRLQSASKRMADTLGVTGPQRLAIRMIGLRPAITATELAQLLHLHKSTLTGVLARLEARGLIHRAVDPEDARVYRFSLTSDGQKLNRQKSGTIEARVAAALERLAPDDLDATRRVLAQLAESMT